MYFPSVSARSSRGRFLHIRFEDVDHCTGKHICKQEINFNTSFLQHQSLKVIILNHLSIGRVSGFFFLFRNPLLKRTVSSQRYKHLEFLSLLVLTWDWRAEVNGRARFSAWVTEPTVRCLTPASESFLNLDSWGIAPNILDFGLSSKRTGKMPHGILYVDGLSAINLHIFFFLQSVSFSLCWKYLIFLTLSTYKMLA